PVYNSGIALNFLKRLWTFLKSLESPGNLLDMFRSKMILGTARFIFSFGIDKEYCTRKLPLEPLVSHDQNTSRNTCAIEEVRWKSYHRFQHIASDKFLSNVFLCASAEEYSMWHNS